METDAETHSQREKVYMGERVYKGGPYQAPPFGAQVILRKRKWRDCEIQRGWKTPEEQDPLNQLSKVHMSSQKLRQQAQGLHGSVPGPLSIYYDF